MSFISTLPHPFIALAAAVCCSLASLHCPTPCCLLQSPCLPVSVCFRVFPCAVPLYLAKKSLCLGTQSLYLSMQSLRLGTQILDNVALPWYVFGFIECSVRSEVRRASAPLCVCQRRAAVCVKNGARCAPMCVKNGVNSHKTWL